MAIRLWPQEFERKDHITKAEKSLLRSAARNFKDGHFAVSIDPVGMSTSSVKMGMYISPCEGVITFSLYSGRINPDMINSYIAYVGIVENAIYNRLLDSKLLIVRDRDFKILKFPYKHILMFPDEKTGQVVLSKESAIVLKEYVTLDFFKPITSKGQEKKIADLHIFQGVRKPYDPTFARLSDLECCAVFERLAPEYTVIIPETENVQIAEKKDIATQTAMHITGKEQEYKTFFLDEYQVAQVNEMGTGHRVVLANPGAGKSVLLLSKAFRYASLYKTSRVLLTCYNSNLADSYKFKRECANFGNNNNLFIMTFHRLVKKIYDECLHIRTGSNIVSDEEVQNCVSMIRDGRVNLKFKAIFVDEVQSFDPLYLELCYLLLDQEDDSTFLMAGDLNQTVRAQSRRGDVPWKHMNGINLDFTGRVKYIEKNYRNSHDIGVYIREMLRLMNNRLSMLNMINTMEYEYNSFTLGNNPTIALKIKTGINRQAIKQELSEAVKEIVRLYKVSYSDIAVLFPVRKKSYLRYYFLYWLEEAFKEADIPYSMIISEDDNTYTRTRYSDVKGVIVSTIESSLGLDFKAVILAGLYPYNYVFPNESSSKEIKSWSGIKAMTEQEQNLVQSQMRAIYTACSRARDILYVLSDLKSGSPVEEIVSKASKMVSKIEDTKMAAENASKRESVQQMSNPHTPLNKQNTPELVGDHMRVEAYVMEKNKKTTIIVDLAKRPSQKAMIGKRIGETFRFDGLPFTYKILNIIDNKH